MFAELVTLLASAQPFLRMAPPGDLNWYPGLQLLTALLLVPTAPFPGP
jgi:hypothetical protein